MVAPFRRHACGLLYLFEEPGGGLKLERELLDLVTEVVGASAEPLPGALEIVDAAAARVPVAVASNSPRSLLDVALRRGRLTGRFAVVLSAEDVEYPKPSPDMYLAAGSRLGVEHGYVWPSRTPTLAPDPHGPRMPCIGVPSPPTPNSRWMWF